MIKAMISHAGEDDLFVDYLCESLERAEVGLDIFVDHKRNMPGDDAQRMIEEARTSIIFIPVISDFSASKVFFINELKTAKASPTAYIFPVRLHCKVEDIPSEIKIAFSEQDKVTGKIWVDFSNEHEWELKFEELLKAIIAKLTELDIYRKDEFFYQDIEIIDKIIARDNPSPAEIKTIVDVFLRKQSYQTYFFKRLKQLSWISYLKIYGFFERNPKPVKVENQTGYSIPRWSVLDYLEWCSTQINEGENSKFGEVIIDAVRSVSNYRDQNGNRIDNFITDWVFIKIIANLPSRFVQIADIQMTASYLESRWKDTLVESELGNTLLPVLLNRNEKEKCLALFNIVTTIKWVNENGVLTPQPLIDAYWLNDLLEQNKDKLANICPLEAAENLISRIAEITDRKPFEFNHIEIAAIEDHPQDEFHKGRLQYILVHATRELLNRLAKKDLGSFTSLITELLEKKHPIFKRLAIYMISSNWTTCSHLLKPFIGPDMFNDNEIKHEVYSLLKDNFITFSPEDKDNIIGWIEHGPNDDESDTADIGRSAYWRQRWLSALILSGNPKAIELHEKYKAITNVEPEHPDFSSWMEAGAGADLSPIPVDILLKKTNSEIANYLNTYTDTNKRWKEPSKRGLEHSLFEVVKTSPEKFDTDLQPFIEVPINYQIEIIRGFQKVWEEKKDIDWANILEFCREIVSSKDFWEKPQEDGNIDYRGLLIEEMADLGTDGTRDDGRAFVPKHLPLAEELLLTLLMKTESKLDRPDDLLSEVLNSAKGRVLTALVNYSLRVARLGSQTISGKWTERVKIEFTKRLDRTFEPDLRFSLTLGKYLAHLNYLDNQWVQNNINKIFPKEQEEYWQAAMEGYLLEGRVYSNLYDLMSINGHYNKAVDTDFRDKAAKKRLLEHLCTGYLLEKELLNDKSGPFSRCIWPWNSENIRDIIWFFWNQREYILGKDNAQGNDIRVEVVGKQKSRILSFWRIIYGILEKKPDLTEDEKKVASGLARLSCYLDSIDAEVAQWLIFSAKYIDKDHTSPIFIQYLLRLCDFSPSSVGSVFIEMLNSTTPTYDQKHIRTLVSKLYELGQADTARRICNIYGSRDMEFLRDIYLQYHH